MSSHASSSSSSLPSQQQTQHLQTLLVQNHAVCVALLVCQAASAYLSCYLRHESHSAASGNPSAFSQKLYFAQHVYSFLFGVDVPYCWHAGPNQLAHVAVTSSPHFSFFPSSPSPGRGEGRRKSQSSSSVGPSPSLHGSTASTPDATLTTTPVQDNTMATSSTHTNATVLTRTTTMTTTTTGSDESDPDLFVPGPLPLQFWTQCRQPGAAAGVAAFYLTAPLGSDECYPYGGPYSGRSSWDVASMGVVSFIRSVGSLHDIRGCDEESALEHEICLKAGSRQRKMWTFKRKYIDNAQHTAHWVDVAIEAVGALMEMPEAVWFIPDPETTVNEYRAVIQEPMWLKKVQAKLKARLYKLPYHFKQDVALIFRNARTFNRPEDRPYRDCCVLEQKFNRLWGCINQAFQRDAAKSQKTGSDIPSFSRQQSHIPTVPADASVGGGGTASNYHHHPHPYDQQQQNAFKGSDGSQIMSSSPSAGLTGSEFQSAPQLPSSSHHMIGRAATGGGGGAAFSSSSGHPPSHPVRETTGVGGQGWGGGSSSGGGVGYTTGAGDPDLSYFYGFASSSAAGTDVVGGRHQPH